MCVCSCIPIGLHLRACVCVCSERVCAPRRCARTSFGYWGTEAVPRLPRVLLHQHRVPAGTCRIYSSAHDTRAATRAFAFVPIGRCRALAAGVTWTCRTSNAPWGARYWHTSVIDAAGAIYVIGGYGDGIGYLQDVWVSTDGGADRARSRGWSGGTQQWY